MFGDSNVIYFSLLGNESRVSDNSVSNQRESELVDAKDLSANDDFKVHSLTAFSEPHSACFRCGFSLLLFFFPAH